MLWISARRFNPFLVRASVYCQKDKMFEQALYIRFQSLLSQGISLLGALVAHDPAAVVRFNPFLVRASVY